MPESRIGSTYSGLQLAYVIEEYVEKFNRDMKQRFPGKELTVEEFQSCYDPKAERDSLSEVAFVCTAYYFSLYNTDKWEPVYQNMGKKSVETAKASYEEALRKYGTDQRKEITGDNPMDINDSNYGNNILLTSDAATNIMKAGIIAAKRDNKIGSDGIADQAEIMTLRICTGEGEPYLKDMALAIHYAVSHGADVIVLPEQNMLYPEEQKQWIIHELKEAEKKGAIVIVPAWNTSIDMDKVEFFPNRKMSKDKELTNLMIVASSDKKGNPVMDTNYGANTLDIYAPGTDIYSAYIGDICFLIVLSLSVHIRNACISCSVCLHFKGYIVHRSGFATGVDDIFRFNAVDCDRNNDFVVYQFIGNSVANLILDLRHTFLSID